MNSLCNKCGQDMSQTTGHICNSYLIYSSEQQFTRSEKDLLTEIISTLNRLEDKLNQINNTVNTPFKDYK